MTADRGKDIHFNGDSFVVVASEKNPSPFPKNGRLWQRIQVHFNGNSFVVVASEKNPTTFLQERQKNHKLVR
jgi:ABC-type tungstate transport system permease subunit